MPKLQIKALLLEIESKLDKNANSFWKIKLAGLPDYFYAFATDYNLKEGTLKSLQTPEKLLNQLTLITYEELPNKENSGTFKKVKELEIL